MDESALLATLLVSLRIAPTLAFAPPFTLMRVPALVRLLLSLSLAAWLVCANPETTVTLIKDNPNLLVSAAFTELFLGIALAISLQIAFAALLTAGRAIDFQVGFGLALLADPTLRTQMPLVGALFAYGAAGVFFASGGPADLLAIWAQSLQSIPLGAGGGEINVQVLAGYTSYVFGLALALAGLALLVLFLIDLAIAFMSRTLPQMNVLVLGFQVKSLALLATLPFVFALSVSLFLRIVRLALETTPRLI